MNTSIINILPDFVANQIAAGEVVNRPASAVKELLENAVDAGANKIELHIEDAGKTLVQVVDNGCGMKPEDARKCFLPHATSKLTTADDLLSLQTMGFRGEALASIAAVAQVELQTRPQEDETGTLIVIEGGKILQEQPCACAPGTSIKVKNIYFNTPARRQFLKSDD
ncbi:MAG: DNA mismatch repair endonuclease MutL, partial [Bacteroidales bacterium]|nr:DNA mismatch repair endonuclease MutL [Bacteroidales bacterium]